MPPTCSNSARDSSPTWCHVSGISRRGVLLKSWPCNGRVIAEVTGNFKYVQSLDWAGEQTFWRLDLRSTNHPITTRKYLFHHTNGPGQPVTCFTLNKHQTANLDLSTLHWPGNLREITNIFRRPFWPKLLKNTLAELPSQTQTLRVRRVFLRGSTVKAPTAPKQKMRRCQRLSGLYVISNKSQRPGIDTSLYLDQHCHKFCVGQRTYTNRHPEGSFHWSYQSVPLSSPPGRIRNYPCPLRTHMFKLLHQQIWHSLKTLGIVWKYIARNTTSRYKPTEGHQCLRTGEKGDKFQVHCSHNTTRKQQHVQLLPRLVATIQGTNVVHTCDCKRLSRPHTHCWKRSCKMTWCSCILLLTRQTPLLYLLGQSFGTHNPKLIPQWSQKHIHTTMLEQLVLESDQKNCQVRFGNQDGMLGVIGQVRELKPTANSHNTFTIKERLELVQWGGLLDRPIILQRCTLFWKIPTLYLLYQDHLCFLQLHKGQLTLHTLRNRTTGIAHKPPHPGNNTYGFAQGPPTTHGEDCWIHSIKTYRHKGTFSNILADRRQNRAPSNFNWIAWFCPRMNQELRTLHPKFWRHQLLSSQPSGDQISRVELATAVEPLTGISHILDLSYSVSHKLLPLGGTTSDPTECHHGVRPTPDGNIWTFQRLMHKRHQPSTKQRSQELQTWYCHSLDRSHTSLRYDQRWCVCTIRHLSSEVYTSSISGRRGVSKTLQLQLLEITPSNRKITPWNFPHL